MSSYKSSSHKSYFRTKKKVIQYFDGYNYPELKNDPLVKKLYENSFHIFKETGKKYLLYRDIDAFFKNLYDDAKISSRKQFLKVFSHFEPYKELIEKGEITIGQLEDLFIKLNQGKKWIEPLFPDFKPLRKSALIDFGTDFVQAQKLVETLQPEDEIIIYHGTDDMDKFLKEGIDTEVIPEIEHFPEMMTIGGKLVSIRGTGLYVSPVRGISGGFGYDMIKMKVKAKDLDVADRDRVLHQVNLYEKDGYTSDESRRNAYNNVFIKDFTPKKYDMNEFYKKYYPNSFKPALSDLLFSRGEPQAVLKRPIKPEEIEVVKGNVR